MYIVFRYSQGSGHEYCGGHPSTWSEYSSTAFPITTPIRRTVGAVRRSSPSGDRPASSPSVTLFAILLLLMPVSFTCL
ncbi:hypothetical protein PENTCL1PPCAC_30423 [Pristionchus entomophagus]|uniref:Uncharacterized protein n=1 Tax=Pristionchus entomophagus TaxID=358040 RepID=A0AAV5UPK8_9BILA|nr:hypothetical protein PENTCL1PPCAC_30423 [Pristionchus entomophagus]